METEINDDTMFRIQFMVSQHHGWKKQTTKQKLLYTEFVQYVHHFWFNTQFHMSTV